MRINPGEKKVTADKLAFVHYNEDHPREEAIDGDYQLHLGEELKYVQCFASVHR